MMDVKGALVRVARKEALRHHFLADVWLRKARSPARDTRADSMTRLCDGRSPVVSH